MILIVINSLLFLFLNYVIYTNWYGLKCSWNENYAHIISKQTTDYRILAYFSGTCVMNIDTGMTARDKYQEIW